MAETKQVRVKARMVASFPRGQWDDQVKFDCKLTIDCEDEEKVGEEEILRAFLAGLRLYMSRREASNAFLCVDSSVEGARIININNVNHFSVDEWYFCR